MDELDRPSLWSALDEVMMRLAAGGGGGWGLSLRFLGLRTVEAGTGGSKRMRPNEVSVVVLICMMITRDFFFDLLFLFLFFFHKEEK